MFHFANSRMENWISCAAALLHGTAEAEMDRVNPTAKKIDFNVMVWVNVFGRTLLGEVRMRLARFAPLSTRPAGILSVRGSISPHTKP